MPLLVSPGPQRSAAFWHNLNMFISGFTLLATYLGGLLTLPAALALRLVLPRAQAETAAMPLAYALPALGLAWWWWRFGLSPSRLRPARTARFLLAHIVLAGCNVVLVTTVLLPILVRKVPTLPAPLARALAMSLPLALVLAAIAWVLVRSTRAIEPEFEATVPLVASAPQAKAPTREVPPSRSERAANLVGVVLGVLLSIPLIFISTIFASTGFQGSSARFYSVVLPLVVAGSVLWVACTAWLAIRKRTGVALVCAWLPVLLLVGSSMVMGLVGPLLSSGLRR